ncbi:DUF4065 domain-containing protein [Candidatus Woesearchaeota archaeon]|jgi:uncharacterized protein YwgA|nr:DUF4065 domain-containing protein [Candidatus Woesearchaeota archaeon]MBT4368251.1 DUF4065 domain-containing protein [Candidatus Woesearchaeota archaeon]MBT4712740.1 DUF4065 domain-containing protein [Candidatus Woesearchaeota archaeon]MBT6639652.1 DUF4065 domain-containing protein [Candidatus Woesearchaeota archaeon]MBT7133824.1 DUF4065 domain-containing protein [Candidatus Woesearchaeota archaeon]
MNKTLKINELIILVVGFIGCVYGRTFIQKLFFLIENELFKDMDLNYIKYHYGPYSTELRDAVEALKRKELIKDVCIIMDGHVGHCYELTEKGKHKFTSLDTKTSRVASKLNSFCDRYKEYKPSELLRLVYSKYPLWTVNSVLVNN